jgi:chromate reductase
MTAILGISGSLRRDSHNTRLLRAAERLLPGGAELEIYGSLRELPHYDADLDIAPAHPAVAHLREAIAGADAVLIATPEFNGTLPGALKNALDWASRPYGESALRGKPVAVVGASMGLFGAVWAQADARKALGIIGSEVLEGELGVGQADSAFDEQGNLLDPEQQAALAGLVDELIARAERVRESEAAVAA